VTFLLLVRPALWRLQGATDILPEAATCQLADRLSNPADRREFVRVQVDHAGRAHPAGPQASHLLMSLANANGLVEVPAKSSLAEGTVTPVIRFDS
jgi:molybdopterin molybdotransferase